MGGYTGGFIREFSRGFIKRGIRSLDYSSCEVGFRGLLGFYWESGKENGNYRGYRGYIGVI